MLPARFPPRLAALGAVLLVLIAGCGLPPERTAPWKSDDRIVQPAGRGSEATGCLVAETVCFGTDDGLERRNAFFVYDEQGRYLDRFPNDTMSPVPLPAGRYVVVTHVFTANRRVQVVIKEGQTTTIRLRDFRTAPEAP